MNRSNIFIGRTGEKIAEAFVGNLRFKIIERNFRTPFGEIDLICLDKNTLVFIEVKTRVSKSFGSPLLSITELKKKTIIKNAIYYLKRFRLFDMDARIDIISINLAINGKFEKIEHLKSAIWLEER
ncbi:MAG: YraN family protein [Candidatus Omnitrophica bacterium]|nr:YraN family protein [Candidatus Omnitrophota bacterium]